MTTTRLHTPRVWIGCLACYNDGKLVGDWVDAADVESVDQALVHSHPDLSKYRTHPSHDELWVFDHENLPTQGEFFPEHALPWGKAYAELNNDELWPAYLSWCTDIQRVSTPPEIADFNDAWCGQWEDFEDFAWEECQAVNFLEGMSTEQQRYFDFDAWSHDLKMNYNTLPAPTGGVWVFDGRF